MANAQSGEGGPCSSNDALSGRNSQPFTHRGIDSSPAPMSERRPQFAVSLRPAGRLIRAPVARVPKPAGCRPGMGAASTTAGIPVCQSARKQLGEVDAVVDEIPTLLWSFALGYSSTPSSRSPISAR